LRPSLKKPKNIEKKVKYGNETNPVKFAAATQAHFIHKYIDIKVKVLKY